MNWTGLTTVFLLATVKFMVAPASGLPFKLSFLESYVATCLGGFVGIAFFYYASEFFIKRAHKKKVEKHAIAKQMGIELIEKKKFTRMNRFIVKIKLKLGIIGISFWAPFFMSIPLGSIVVAKFYGKRKITFPLMCIGILINGLATTSITYLFVKNA